MERSTSLIDQLGNITDPRPGDPIYPLVNILFMMICGVVAGADGFVAIARFANTKKYWFAKVYDELISMDWQWQSVDGAMTKAPLGGEKTGKNPTDRGKLGTKRSLQTDASGIPVGLAVRGANVHDTRLLQETIEDCVDRAATEVGAWEDLYLDKTQDSNAVRKLIESVYGYTSHVRSRGEEKRELGRASGERPRRWVAERTHVWPDRFRTILIRWDKRIHNHIAGPHLAFAYFIYSRLGFFG